jgi:hypothetical protein
MSKKDFKCILQPSPVGEPYNRVEEINWSMTNRAKRNVPTLASPRIELGVRDYETLVLPLHQEAFERKRCRQSKYIMKPHLFSTTPFRDTPAASIRPMTSLSQ